ncbi:MAG: hypothetical protein KAS32_22460, partial [Candidatus Peribacteraceae bacterium]|nr:hypothetical protein [Candidatus Peribacteraceae bacterium]
MANKNQKFFTYEGTISEISAKEKINFKNADGSDGFFMKQIVTVDCLVGEGEWSRNLPIPFGVNGKKQEALEAF